MKQNRILFIGAHPDDADILCGGTAIKLSRAGYIVKFVSATNGDTGHMTLSRAETARVRYLETQASARKLGLYGYEVLPHDCGLEANINNRREMIRVIRRFNPDIVISHRPCDYHPDHRATGQIVMDCAYVCMVPHFCEDTPIPNIAPIFAYSFDRFDEPRPHRADAIVEIDSVMEEKICALCCHYSQFFEWLPWVEGNRNFDASNMTESEKRYHVLRFMKRFRFAADNNRRRLIELHGEIKGNSIMYAETFEQSPYSRTITRDEFQKLLEP